MALKNSLLGGAISSFVVNPSSTNLTNLLFRRTVWRCRWIFADYSLLKVFKKLVIILLLLFNANRLEIHILFGSTAGEEIIGILSST